MPWNGDEWVLVWQSFVCVHVKRVQVKLPTFRLELGRRRMKKKIPCQKIYRQKNEEKNIEYRHQQRQRIKKN